MIVDRREMRDAGRRPAGQVRRPAQPRLRHVTASMLDRWFVAALTGWPGSRPFRPMKSTWALIASKRSATACLLRCPSMFCWCGTNGKGSSVAMLEALLRRGGLPSRCLHLATSHALQRTHRCCRCAVSRRGIVAAFERVEAVRDDMPLTYFEFGTLAALVIFASSISMSGYWRSVWAGGSMPAMPSSRRHPDHQRVTGSL